MSWTQERTDRAVAMWNDHVSATLIAAELGDISRNGVIVKMHRLGLAKGSRLTRPKISAIGAVPKPQKQKRATGVDGALASGLATMQRKRKPNGSLAGFPPSRPPVATTEFICRIMQLENHSCRFPLWSAETPHVERFYCGTPEADMLQRIPYCRYHDRIIHAREPETMMQAAE